MNSNKIEQQIAELKLLLIQGSLAQKPVLTLPEAAIYTGRSKSNLYKLVSQRRISASKPENKILYFSRESLEKFMLRNPLKTVDEIEAEAVSRVAFPQKKQSGKKARK